MTMIQQPEACKITRRVYGYCYPKNGNLHNPTPKVKWDVTYKGRRVGTFLRLRDAEEVAANFSADPEW